MKNLLLTLAGIACLSLTACDDDDDTMSNIEPTASRMEILTSHDWVVVSQEAATAGLPDALRTNRFSEDDIFRFRENGEAVRDEGPTKEEGSPQIVEVAQWSFMNEEKSLDAGFQSLPINDEIVELNNKRLVLRRSVGEAQRFTIFEAL